MKNLSLLLIFILGINVFTNAQIDKKIELSVNPVPQYVIDYEINFSLDLRKFKTKHHFVNVPNNLTINFSYEQHKTFNNFLMGLGYVFEAPSGLTLEPILKLGIANNQFSGAICGKISMPLNNRWDFLVIPRVCQNSIGFYPEIRIGISFNLKNSRL